MESRRYCHVERRRGETGEEGDRVAVEDVIGKLVGKWSANGRLIRFS